MNNWSFSIQQIANYISDISKVHGRFRHIEISKRPKRCKVDVLVINE